MDPLLSRSQRGIVYICSAVTAAVSLAVLFGWAAGFDAPKTILPGYPEMKPAGAGGFLLMALGLALSVRDERGRRFRWAPAVTGCIVAAGGAIVLCAYIFHISSQINSALIPNLDPASATTRVSPISACSFILLGISLALVRLRRFDQFGGCLATLALAATYVAILGHLYHANTFYGFSDINGMPLHTAFLFIVMGIGLFARNRGFHLVRLITSDSLGGAAARRLIPIVVLIPSIIGWLRVMGQERGLYDTGFGSAMSVTTLTGLMLGMVLIYSRTMHRSDQERRAAEADLADKETRYRLLVDFGQGSISTHDLDGKLLSINPAGTRVLGYEEHEMVGHDLREFLPRNLLPAFEAYLRTVRYEGIAEGLFAMVAKDGRTLTFRFNNVLVSEDGVESYVLGHAQDVTELLEAQKQLKDLSLRDDLTGLYNRRGFLTMAEHQLKLERHDGTARGLTLLFADMDGLKEINDTYGHEAGSLAIKALGRLIVSVVRSADLVARWGGDEFVILSVGAQDENAQLMVDRIMERIDEYNAESRDPYLISCSIGLAAVEDQHDLDDVIARADEAMYIEKKRRKSAALGEISDQPHSFIRPWTGHSPRI